MLQAFFDVRLMSERSKNIKNQRLRCKILNRFFVAYTLKMSTSVNIYIFEFQVFSGCFPTIYENVRFCKVVIPFLYLPSILFYSGENLFFYSGKVFRFLLASFSLRSLFYGLQKLQILTASAPLQTDFSRLPLGFLLASFSTSSRVQYCFSRASFSQFAHS